MANWQTYFISIFGVFSFIGFVKGFLESKKHKAYHSGWIFNLIGAFVWADAVVFGLFWTLISITCLILNNWILFLLIYSVFWLVRSIGETIYWFLQQFSTINRCPPENYKIHKIFKNDSVWFVFQIFWQCATVVTIITSIYLAHFWISSL
jgi:hypothetical protein